ncbi:hypothetical protein LCGC14_2239130 [marine sediment metagenome]|uniref:Uncharacterized protein n=1 Tax=marine sediment metagenome TaxID=412755 RepID=A0A0F9FII1_9ZZZZ
MGKAKRERKKELSELDKWFEEFSKACPWRKQGDIEGICGGTAVPHKNKEGVICLACIALNCAPLYLANRLIQQTFGPRRYENDTLDPTRKH